MSFPTSPSNNSTAVVNGITYTFNSSTSSWTRKANTSVGVTYTASSGIVPPNPKTGDQWYNTTTDVLYQYINDGTSSYWIDINSTVISSTSWNGNIVANTLSLSSALAATSGGTGQNAYTSGDILVANTGNALSVLPLSSTAGHVLQSNGTALVYDILDGGTF